MSRTRPRVLFDATAVPPDRRGVGRYVDSLLPELDRLEVDLVVVTQRSDEAHYVTLCPEATVLAASAHVASRPARLVWEQVTLPRIVAATRPDVVHSPHYTRPLAVRRPVVVTLHDATFFTHPELHVRVKRSFFRTWSRASLRSAARCIVPSAATRDELVRVTRTPATSIEVIHLGVDATVFHPPTADEVASARAALDIGARRYVAFLGTLEPRKNLPNLIRGFAAAVEGSEQHTALVVAGGSGWDESLDAVVAALPPGVDVRLPGFLPLEDLSGYLGGAEVVAYPSFGEGFGLPVLEGMACGSAVLTTPHLALAEVGGDAVEYTKTDPASIGRSLRQLLADGPRRADLGRRGLERSAGFSWTAAAEAHLEVYRSVAA